MRGLRLLASLLTVLTVFTTLPGPPVMADPDVIIRLGSSSTDGATVDTSSALRSTELTYLASTRRHVLPNVFAKAFWSGSYTTPLPSGR